MRAMVAAVPLVVGLMVALMVPCALATYAILRGLAHRRDTRHLRAWATSARAVDQAVS